MPIVPQTKPVSYSFLLALPAPSIAGLLPARTGSPDPVDDRSATTAFVFDRPALADLTTTQRDRLFEAADVLLEIAIEFMVGTFNEDALRAAEVVFHRAAGGRSAIRPLGPAAFNAEIDADRLEMAARIKRARAMSTEDAEAIIGQMRARRQGGAA